MHARARLLGHSIHQMLIVFPLGLLGTAVVFDGIYLATSNSRLADASYWMILTGVVMGLVAAVFGTIDFSAIPRGTRANRVGFMHAGSMVLALALFAVSWVIRRDQPADPPTVAIALSFAGLGCAALGGWLGGELVTRLGVGVDEGANLNAPNSIMHRSSSAADRSDQIGAALSRNCVEEP